MINVRDFLRTADGDVHLSQALKQAARIAEQRLQEQGMAGKPVVFFPAGQYLVAETVDLSSGPDIMPRGEPQVQAG